MTGGTNTLLRSRLNRADNFQEDNEDQDFWKKGESIEAGKDNECGKKSRHQYADCCFLKVPIPNQHEYAASAVSMYRMCSKECQLRFCPNTSHFAVDETTGRKLCFINNRGLLTGSESGKSSLSPLLDRLSGFYPPVLNVDEEMWTLLRKLDRPLTTGRLEDRIAIVKEWTWITDESAEAERLRLVEEFSNWCRRSRYCGEFDFGDEADFRRGLYLFAQLIARRYGRGRSFSPAVNATSFGFAFDLLPFEGQFDVRPICEEELRATGWDRRDYIMQ